MRTYYVVYISAVLFPYGKSFASLTVTSTSYHLSGIAILDVDTLLWPYLTLLIIQAYQYKTSQAHLKIQVSSQETLELCSAQYWG